MKVLLVCYHDPVASGRYMRDAFRRLGVDVCSIGPESGRAIWGLQVAPHRVWHPDVPPNNHWTPDLIVVMDCEIRLDRPLYPNVPHIAYGVDNHVRSYRQPAVTHYFLAHSKGPAMPVGEADTTWLPCAYDPVTFTPSEIPWSKRQIDVACVGNLYPQRATIVDALKRSGLVVASGYGPVYEEFRDVHHNARISLCVSKAGDVAIRVFETAAMGCCIISDPCHDLGSLNAKGISLFNSGAAAVGLTHHLLRHPEIAQAQIAESLAWVRPHTWDARAQSLLEWHREHYRTRLATTVSPPPA